jgi:tetratricopeptide (TPR) repeat protein
MSLLLEALKKAEKAKEEAQRRAKGEAEVAAPLELQETATRPRPETRPVLTRAELPDISKPLEILSDDISPRPATNAPEARPSFSTQRGAGPGPKAAVRPAVAEAPAPDASQSERSAARKVFEVKFKESNPRLPFYIAMGALGLFAFGTVGYFWYQLRPAPSLVNLSPAASREAVASSPAPGLPQSVPAAPAAPSPIPGMPATSSAARASGSPTPAIPRASGPQAPNDRAAATTPVARQGLSLRSSSSSVATRDAEPAPRAAPQVNPKVDSAYTSYRSGDLEGARADYQEVLRDDPSNRDALLGMAAVDIRSGRFEAAEGIYLRLLRADPRDPHAQAALIALRGARQDPLVTESRLKNLLAADPGAHVLNFALGNQLAQQGRWGEAQQEYFKAFAADPENADFAYNLAVSLDHLRQPKLALDYYQRAIALAARRGASFDTAAARQRVSQLAGP